MQVVLSKCIRIDQDWSKYWAIYKSFNAYSWEYQTNFGGRTIATKRRAEALPVGRTNIPRNHVMLKFRDEDAEVVMAKPLEGGSDSEREQPLLPEPTPVPAPPELPGEAVKRDGRELRKPSGEETPNKKQKVLFANEKTLGEMEAFPSTPMPSKGRSYFISSRLPSAPSRPSEAFELPEEESPRKKLRPGKTSIMSMKNYTPGV